MTEFLTENARRAYPLEREWPAGLSSWQDTLLDACVGTNAVLSAPLALIAVRCVSDTAVFRIGQSSSSYVDVTVAKGTGAHDTVFASATVSGVAYKAFLTVNGTAVDRVIAASSDTSFKSVGVNLSMRCISFSRKMVTAVSAYAPTICTRPKFTGSETPVVTITEGDVAIVSKDGIDAESIEMNSFEGNLLRISAVTAPADTTTEDEDVDLMVRGDDCISVETIPGVYAVYDATNKNWILKKWSEDAKYESADMCGVIRVGSKCKACCQCEDYESATKSLRPAETATFSIQTLLDDAKDKYNAAVTKFEAYKVSALASINVYDNVHAAASSAVSGGVYGGSNAYGYRSRLAITLTIENMTQETATISGVRFAVPGFTFVKVGWSTAGASSASGDSISGKTWTLAPGDTLLVSATYSVQSNTNTATKPSGTKAYYTAKIPSRESSGELEVQVK